MHKSSIQRVAIILLCATAATFLGPPRAPAESFWNQLFGPADGQFDVSSVIASERGFLPVPILIAEPAIGYGGGMTAVFFHEDAEDAEKRRAAMESDQDDISGLLPPEQFNIKGLFILQEIKLRLWDTDFFAGGRYQYLGANVDFDDFDGSRLPSDLDTDDPDSTVSQLGLLLSYQEPPDGSHSRRYDFRSLASVFCVTASVT